MLKYITLFAALGAVVLAQDSLIDDLLEQEMQLPCAPKPCVPICKPVTKYTSYGAFKLPYTQNVCADDKACLTANAKCIATLLAAMKAAEAAEKDMIAKAKLANSAKATKADKDAAAAAKKVEEAKAKAALDAGKAALTVAEKETATAKAALARSDASFKAKKAVMNTRLKEFETAKAGHLAAQKAYANAKGDAAKAADAYNAAVKAHCDAEAVHATAVKYIGHGHFKKDECKKQETPATSAGVESGTAKVIKYIGAHPYPYATRASAATACKKAGYAGLCSKAQGEGFERCGAGWYSDYKGYWMSKTQHGCSSVRGWQSWGHGKAGAYCCSIKYKQGAAGTECALGTRITNKDECLRTAANSVGVTPGSSWAGSTTAIPVGCSIRNGGDLIPHWNTATSGTGRSDLRPICKFDKDKIAHLKVAHEALKHELAEAKAELKEHFANAAAKAKAAAAEAEEAAVTKKAYEDQQALISNLAKALSDEKRGAKQDAEAEAKIVAREVEEDGKAKKEVSAAAAALKKWKEQQEAPAARLAEAQDKVKVDAQQTAAARAHQKSEAARFAARVAAAKKRLADAQGALGGLHAAHMKEAGEAASAKSQAAAAEAIRKLKEKNVANHQKAVNESAKKIGEYN